MLKVNEFTLAGAVLADSLDQGAGKKETAGSQLTPRLKARHFQKNTIHPHNLAMDCFTLSGVAMTLQNIPSGYNTPRVHYARAIHGRWRVIVLFFLFVKVSSFQEKNKSDTQRAFTLVLADSSKHFLDTKKAWS